MEAEVRAIHKDGLLWGAGAAPRGAPPLPRARPAEWHSGGRGLPCWVWPWQSGIKARR